MALVSEISLHPDVKMDVSLGFRRPYICNAVVSLICMRQHGFRSQTEGQIYP